MARPLTLALLLLLLGTTHAQTYFYIDEISVQPASPTTSDAITIALIGGLSSGGAYIVSATHTVVDNLVYITVVAADPGGISVIVPHTEEIEIGNLPAGSYGILVDGSFILDSAPEIQHSFNVSGGDPCEDLELISIGWHPFDANAILVRVTNTMENSAFGYPGFVLLDSNGDTLAQEAVVYKGIGSDSWHTLDVHEDAIIPDGSFQGELHLWTGFYADPACTWDRTVDLCPPSECVTLYANLDNVGGGIALGTFPWTITDQSGIIAQGQFELTPETLSDNAEVCLAPGSYQMAVTFDHEPTGGQLAATIYSAGFIAGPSTPVIWQQPNTFSFDLLANCIDVGNGVEEVIPSAGLFIGFLDDAVEVRDPHGKPLGAVTMHDASGRLVFSASTAANTLIVPVENSGAYVLRCGSAVSKVAMP